MIHKSFIYEEKESNFAPEPKESVTDITGYRPDIVSLRDKAISIAEKGGGNIGLYDSDSKLDEQTMKALSYARNSARDITEVEAAKNILTAKIENDKNADKNKIKEIKNEKAIKEVQESIKKVAENTSPKED